MAPRTARSSAATLADDSATTAPASYPARLHLRFLGLTAAALLSVATAACGDDDKEEIDDGVDRTEVTSASGSAVPGQPQEPVNTDPVNTQVSPTIRP